MPIKDVKTFIRAMRGWSARCRRRRAGSSVRRRKIRTSASERRSLEASLRPAGQGEVPRFSCRIGEVPLQPASMVLTSISEAQPLVILRSLGCRRPGGEQRRRLLPRTDRRRRRRRSRPRSRRGGGGDRRPAGHFAGDLALLRNPQRWQAAQAVGLQRVERYYTEALMLGRYRGLYREATEIA
ncbi:hypothetical protein P4234_32305 [Pseudomonas aeruginosa]|nr:hypothetical protein [Pseudomonas aeruginosa]